MPESDHSKYIITERRRDSRDAVMPPGVDPASITDTKSHFKLMSLDDHVLKGSLYTEVVWMWPGGSDVYPETAEPAPHAHEYDEVLGFFGSDFDAPYDLGGEIEFWLEDEKFLAHQELPHLRPQGHVPLPSGDPGGKKAHLPLLIRPGRHLRAGDGRGVSEHGPEAGRPSDAGREPMSRPITDLARVMDVSGRKVIVTGGSRGIGWGICQAFAQRGADVAILDIDVAAGEAAAQELRESGGDHVFVECDVTDRGMVERAVGSGRPPVSATSTCW